jgi:lipid-binding SYLF domain-containing protein
MIQKRLWTGIALACLACGLSAGRAHAGIREDGTIESATEVLDSLAGLHVRAIPPSLLQDAQGVAIVPNMIKAGFVVGGRHGRGVMLVREGPGWARPVFITLTGGSFGWQIGVQSTDLVLVFKTRAGVERVMRGKGKITLGADLGIAAGPIGRQAEADTDMQLKSEIFSYSRSRGLFAGLSLEGAALLVDHEGTDIYYKTPRPPVFDPRLNQMVQPPPPEARLQMRLAALSAKEPPVLVGPPPVVMPPTGAPAPMAPAPIAPPPPPGAVLPAPRPVENPPPPVRPDF